jgi:hypothetical protein
LIKGLVLICFVILASGCGIRHIQALRDAETVFNRASEADNRERFSNAEGITSAGSALADYRLAAKMLDDLIRRERGNLENDRLLCTAVAVQALSLWRIGEHDSALSATNSARSCLDTTEASPAPRDSALLRAVPGLVRIDQAKAKVDNGKPGDLPSIRQLISDAHRDLNEAGRFVPSDHPLREYLLLSHLAATRVLQESAAGEQLQGKEQTDLLLQSAADARCWLSRYSCHLQRSTPAPEADRRMGFWNGILGVSVTKVECAKLAECSN